MGGKPGSRHQVPAKRNPDRWRVFRGSKSIILDGLGNLLKPCIEVLPQGGDLGLVQINIWYIGLKPWVSVLLAYAFEDAFSRAADKTGPFSIRQG